MIATVNGEPIYKSAVEIKKRINEISKQNAINQVDQLMLSDEELEKWQNTKLSDDDILQELIKSKVLLLEAEKENIAATDEEARKLAKYTYFMMKSAAEKEDSSGSNYKNYQILKDYMKAMDISEEEYLNQATEEFRIILTKTKMLEEKGITAVDYDKYIDSLVEKADIQYK